LRRKRKTGEEHENLERWLVSYADFITLLFTFFAALYALSSVDKTKVESFSGSLRQAFKVIDQPIIAYADNKKSLLENIRNTIKDTPGISARTEPRGTVVTFTDDVLFSSGSADLRPESYKALESVAKTLAEVPGKITIEGHTDNVSVSGGKYSSNWELSTARAAAVLAFYLGQGLDPNKFSLSGYAEYRPLISNATPEGRAGNRRVELVIAK
jgi:chemotaxis protein MotB